MPFSYHDLKKFLYIGLTAMGVLLICASWHCINIARTTFDGASHEITAVVLLAVGSACLLFGFETYLLKEDPDIWR